MGGRRFPSSIPAAPVGAEPFVPWAFQPPSPAETEPISVARQYFKEY